MDVEKVLCCDKGGDANALATAALMNGGGVNGWMNNPFAYLIFMMFAERFNNGNWGRGADGAQGAAFQSQLDSLRNQISDNQNSQLLLDAVKGNTAAIGQLAQNLNCDFNALNSCCCELRNAVTQVAGQVGFSKEAVINAVNMGNCGLLQAVQNCCCQTQRQIAEFRADVQLQTCQQTGELRNGQRDLGAAIAQGFAQTAYETQRQTCDIINAGKDNTQRIIDTLNGHWRDELQQKYDRVSLELSQERQNRYLIEQLKTTTTATA